MTSIINTVDAVITKNPVKIDSVYNELEQELVSAGEVDGGTIYYAVTVDANEIPDSDSYSVQLPIATEVGYYYVWYKVVADKNHNDLSAVSLTSIIFEEDWVNLNGVVYQSDGETENVNALVKLIKGNQVVVKTTTDVEGKYQFIVPTGVYNIVIEDETNIKTVLVSVFENKEQDVVMYAGKTESLIEVDDDGKYSGISVGGLDIEANSIRINEGISDEQSLSILMTIEPKTQDIIANADDIIAVAKNKSLEFLDIKVKKTIDAVTTTLSETINIFEIVVPYEKINRHDLIVYSYHNQAVRTFDEIQFGDEIVDGTFRLDKENGYIFIYTNCFSTFAIGYTPHYKVDTTLSLGSFTGTVNLTLVSQDDETVYTLLDVEVGKVSFADIPMGDYILTISWEDGVVNTLTMPLRISGKDSTTTTANAQSNASNDLGVMSQKQEVELIDVTNDDYAIVDLTNSYQNCNYTIESEIVIDTNNSLENVEVESVKVLDSKPKAQTANQQTELVDMLNKQTENVLEQEKYIVSNQSNKAVFKFENIAISEIGFAEKYGNLIISDVGYKLKKNKGELKNV